MRRGVVSIIRRVDCFFDTLEDGGRFDVEGFGEAEECGELPPGFQLREERAVNVSSERDFLLGKTPVNTKLSYNSPKSGSNIFFHGREGIAGRGKELLVITNN